MMLMYEEAIENFSLEMSERRKGENGNTTKHQRESGIKIFNQVEAS